MKERPILFSGPMVRAILDGAKTQTRRLVKLRDFGPSDEPGYNVSFTGRNGWTHHHTPATLVEVAAPVRVGDTLWVRETFYCDHVFAGVNGTPEEWRGQDDEMMYYRADVPSGRFGDAGYWSEPGGKWRPSIHMPRWASRLSLRVTDVRVERLDRCNGEDAEREGAFHWARATPDSPSLRRWKDARDHSQYAAWMTFAALWEHVHGEGAWERDRERWVWVYTFEVVGG